MAIDAYPDIDLCMNCWCMTRTIIRDGLAVCGKCDEPRKKTVPGG